MENTEALWITDLIRILHENFECSLLMERNQTNSFSVGSGVRQGCILSPILFNIALDYIMRQTTQNAQHGIQWPLFSQIEDLDCTIIHNSKSSAEEGTASHIKCYEHWDSDQSEKTKVMCMNLKERLQMKIDKEELEVVTDFTYLGSNISVKNSVQKYISARINKARNSYCSLRNIMEI